MQQGSCLCQSVKFRFDATAGGFTYCHCRSCRKASGSAFAANVSVPKEAFSITEGEAAIGVFESSAGKWRHFCRSCGSPLYATSRQHPEFVRIRLGTLDTPFDGSVSAQIFVAEKASWYEPDPRIPSFPQRPE